MGVSHSALLLFNKTQILIHIFTIHRLNLTPSTAYTFPGAVLSLLPTGDSRLNGSAGGGGEPWVPHQLPVSNVQQPQVSDLSKTDSRKIWLDCDSIRKGILPGKKYRVPHAPSYSRMRSQKGHPLNIGNCSGRPDRFRLRAIFEFFSSRNHTHCNFGLKKNVIKLTESYGKRNRIKWNVSHWRYSF